MKNICLLIYNLRSGGAEHVLAQWSILLSEQYNVFMTIYADEDKVWYPYGGRLVNLNVPSNNKSFLTKVLIVLKRALVLHKFVKRNHIDTVVSFCNECNLVNTISLHRANKVCSIRSASDIYANQFVKYVILSHRNKLIIQTNALKNQLINIYGDRIEDKVFVFGNPFDTERIQAMSKETPPQCLSDVLSNKKTIVNVASFKRLKNHSGLLRVFEIVANVIPDVYLILIGANQDQYEKIAKMANESKFADRIIFAGELSNPFSVVSRCSVFVLPSLKEGIPNALAEAIICGVPVIASNCPTGPAELLNEDPSTVSFDKNGVYQSDYGLLVKQFSDFSEYAYDDQNEEYMPFANAIMYALSPIGHRDLTTKAKEGSKRFDLNAYKKELIHLLEGLSML